MVSENLKEWIKEKRKKGVSDERIKESLEETGNDPSIVDELENPFESDSSDVEPSEDLFNSSKPESIEGVEQDNGDSSDDQSVDEDTGEETGIEDGTGSGFDFPSSSLPSVPSFSKGRLAIILSLILVLVGAAAVYNGFGPYLNDLSGSNIVPASEESSDLQGLEALDSKYSGCPDAGVRIQTISSSDGVTSADVLVTRNEAWVVLEVKRNGNLQGFATKNMVGESQITVDAVGDKAELRPLGCKKFYSRRDIR